MCAINLFLKCAQSIARNTVENRRMHLLHSVLRLKKASWKWGHLSYLHSTQTTKPALLKYFALGLKEDGNEKNNFILSPMGKEKRERENKQQNYQRSNITSWCHNP